jgi:hypothetical protein
VAEDIEPGRITGRTQQNLRVELPVEKVSKLVFKPSDSFLTSIAELGKPLGRQKAVHLSGSWRCRTFALLAVLVVQGQILFEGFR